jgi:ABC-type lipoprotein export system ATPase subunit
VTGLVVAQLGRVGVDFRVGDTVVHALSDVSLTIEAGTSTAIVGRSGSGKSTLISVLSLLRQPCSGQVTVSGQLASGLKDAELSSLRSRFVGTIFQSFHLDPAFTAEENAMLPWYFGSAMPRRAARTRARDLLGLLGIGDLAGRHPSEMSGGQRQRVAIARALFGEPALLVADEPTGNLDETTAAGIADVIFGLAEQTSTAVVVVTHDREIAERAGTLVQLVRGSLVSATIGCSESSATSTAGPLGNLSVEK